MTRPTMKFACATLGLALGASISSCSGADSSQDEAAEVTPEEERFVEEFAGSMCAKLDDCGELDSYGTLAECEEYYQESWADAVTECDLDSEQMAECLSVLESSECDDASGLTEACTAFDC